MIVPNSAAACPYRVGDYLFSENATHPSTSWPGTSWVPVQGQMILGASKDYPVGSEGGEAEHTLTEKEIANHCHIGLTIDSTPLAWAWPALNAGSGNSGALTTTGTAGTYPVSGYSGGGEPHNNMPPYRAAHIWRRTA